MNILQFFPTVDRYLCRFSLGTINDSWHIQSCRWLSFDALCFWWAYTQRWNFWLTFVHAYVTLQSILIASSSNGFTSQYSSPQNENSSSSFALHPTISVCISYFNHPEGYIVLLTCDLNLHFPDDQLIWVSFSCMYLSVWTSCFVGCPFNYFAIFENPTALKVLYILDRGPFFVQCK